MSERPDYFTLLGLPPRYDLDGKTLEDAYFRLQREHHPDRLARHDNAAGDTALQAARMAALLNEAYQTLKHPRKRGEHLLAERGIRVGGERDTIAPSPALLAEMLERREALADASPQQAEAIAAAAREEYAACGQQFAAALEQDALDAAAQTLLRMRYLEKLEEEAEEKHLSISVPPACGGE